MQIRKLLDIRSTYMSALNVYNRMSSNNSVNATIIGFGYRSTLQPYGHATSKKN